MRIKEDMIFDHVRSRLYWDIQSFELIIPATVVATGIEKSLEYLPIKIWKSFSEVCPTGPSGITGRILLITGIWLMHSFSGFSMPGL
jgi:hypothetical protein